MNVSTQTENKIAVVEQQELFAGPIPHPDILLKYEEIQPGFADRILTMAEKDEEHRHEMDRSYFKAQSRDNLLGALLGFFALIIWLVVSVILFYFAYKAETDISRIAFNAAGVLLSASWIGAVIKAFILKK